MSKRPQSKRLRAFAERALHAWAALSLAMFGFVGPLVLGLLSLAMPVFGVPEWQPEPTRDYMVAMSMSPFPEAGDDVMATIDELQEPPPSFQPPADRVDPEAPPAPKEPEEKLAPKASDKAKDQLASAGSRRGKGEGRGKDGSGGGVGDSKGKGPGGEGVKGPGEQEGGKGKAQKCLPDNPDIKHVKDHRYRVKQGLVDYYVNHLGKAQKMADTYWRTNKSGEVIGFRVRRIRCGNDLYQLGFRNRDIVMAVNDIPVTTIPGAISAYLKLRKNRVLRVKVRRKGQDIVLRYRLT